MHTPSTTEFIAFVEIDWADRKHDVCLTAQPTSNNPASTSMPQAI